MFNTLTAIRCQVNFRWCNLYSCLFAGSFRLTRDEGTLSYFAFNYLHSKNSYKSSNRAIIYFNCPELSLEQGKVIPQCLCDAKRPVWPGRNESPIAAIATIVNQTFHF